MRLTAVALASLLVACSSSTVAVPDDADAAASDVAPEVPADVPPDLPVDVPLDAKSEVADSTLDVADADATDAAPPVLPSCFGDARSIVLSSGLPFTEVAVGVAPARATGMFLIDVATTASTIDLAAFSGTKPTASGCNPALLGQACSFADLDFFGSWGTVTLRTADHSWVTGTVREAGILATDFFSVFVLSIDYAGLQVRKATKASFCDDATLTVAGMVPLTTAGFYSNDFSKLAPLTTVDSTASPGVTVANVPTVPLWVAGVRAVAQLDTGFDDGLVPWSINVNQAFYDAIVAARPTALVRDASRDLSLSTCVSGVSEPVWAYTLSAGALAELRADTGATARAWSKAVLFVKRTPTSAKKCGGIGTWTAPAAQMASSFFRDLGVVSFDPFSSRVWVRKG